MEKSVGIIGAGISGLLACKYALSKGFEPIVFESQSSIGGVWTKTIQTTKLQTPKIFYQFSDFPWSSSVTDDFPDHHQTIDYINSYAHHFDLLNHIKFNSKVVGIEFEGHGEEEMQSWSLWGGTGEPFSSKGTWKLLVENNVNHSTEEHKVNFMIVCVGRFGGVPNIPKFPKGKGPEKFDGEVIHAKDYSAMDYEKAARFLKGKKVIVVGFQKFAMDIATECSIANEIPARRTGTGRGMRFLFKDRRGSGTSSSLVGRPSPLVALSVVRDSDPLLRLQRLKSGVENPCTVLYRREYWHVPDLLPWGVPLACLYFNRFAEFMLHKPGQSFLHTLIAMILSPLRWGFSKFVESYIKSKLKLAKHGMVPKHSFLQEFSSCLTTTVPTDFYDRVDQGSIVLKKSPNFSFCKHGIVVDGENEPLKTDLVILATGFKGYENIQHIFSSSTFKDFIAGPRDSKIPLYRECIHPRIPQLAIIGFSESVSNLYTSEMRSRWLVELLDGTWKLPSIIEMEKDVKKWDKYMKQYSGRYYQRSCIGGIHIWYNDQLCKDMGWNSKRKKGLLAELFEPYGPCDYACP